MDAKTGSMGGGCPFHGDGGVRALLGRTNKDWWPDALDLHILTQGGQSPDPMGEDFDYCEAFNALDYNALKADLHALMTDSQPWCRRITATTARSSSAWRAGERHLLGLGRRVGRPGRRDAHHSR